MRVRVWNAYASNNSGSYTIVGSFADAATAQRIAAELQPVLDEETRWRAAPGQPDASSPLVRHLAAHGIRYVPDGDDWPAEWAEDKPRAFAFDRAVVVHSHYTITMPRELGALFYALGGRVAQELDHAHHQLVVVVTLWWERALGQAAITERALLLEQELKAPDGPLLRHASPDAPTPVCVLEPSWEDHAPLGVAAVFGDLVAGCTAVREAARAREARMLLRFFEAPGEVSDPLAPWRTR